MVVDYLAFVMQYIRARYISEGCRGAMRGVADNSFPTAKVSVRFSCFPRVLLSGLPQQATLTVLHQVPFASRPPSFPSVITFRTASRQRLLFFSIVSFFFSFFNSCFLIIWPLCGFSFGSCTPHWARVPVAVIFL